MKQLVNLQIIGYSQMMTGKLAGDILYYEAIMDGKKIPKSEIG